MIRSAIPVYHLLIIINSASTEINTLSLHDALPISRPPGRAAGRSGGSQGTRRRRKSECACDACVTDFVARATSPDRKSTRLNSSHSQISYAVFCLKKKKYI